MCRKALPSCGRLQNSNITVMPFFVATNTIKVLHRDLHRLVTSIPKTISIGILWFYWYHVGNPCRPIVLRRIFFNIGYPQKWRSIRITRDFINCIFVFNAVIIIIWLTGIEPVFSKSWIFYEVLRKHRLALYSLLIGIR